MSEPDGFALDIDVGAALGHVLRHWRRVAAGLALGAVAAVLVLLLVPPRFDGQALVLVRTAPDASSLMRQQLGPIAELAPSALGGASKTEIETELALLQSRAVLGIVVDSLRLQIQPRLPSNRVPAGIVDSLRLPGRFRPRSVSLGGGASPVPEGHVFRAAAAPETDVRLLDREDAIDELADHLETRVQGGDVVRVRYRGRDSVTAAQVPNLIVAIYLGRRRTVDRGLNQRRVEFLAAKSDSIDADLKRASEELRTSQDAGGLLFPEPAAKALLDRIAQMETQMALVRADRAALDSVLARSQDPRFDARMVAAVPSLLKSPAVNDIVAQLDAIDTQRGLAMADATERAPRVVALARASDSLRAQLLPLARTYAGALRNQAASLDRDMAETRRALNGLPGSSALVGRRSITLSQTVALSSALRAQLLEARLSALTEGGDVRLVDPAVAPRKIAFPRPLLVWAAALVMGLLVGVFWASLPSGNRTTA